MIMTVSVVAVQVKTVATVETIALERRTMRSFIHPSFASPPPGPARSIRPTFVSPVPPQASGSEEDDDASVRPREMVAFDALKEGRHSALSGITELVNGFNRLFGYGSINQNRVDSSSAYYRCGCTI